jgi:uncharacterized protein (DUF2252 family)
MYGTPQRELVFDLNDFDEVGIGLWEWDLKRLTASVNVAGRQNGLNRRESSTECFPETMSIILLISAIKMELRFYL